MKIIAKPSKAVLALLLCCALLLPFFVRPPGVVIAAPLYGCGDYPGDYDGEPIGGGVGYTTLYTAATADAVVTTAAGLKAALAAAVAGDIIYVQDNTTITLNDTSQMYNVNLIGFYVPDGVTLAGGRGNVGMGDAGIIQVGAGFKSDDWCYFIACGTGSKVAGLELYGNQDTALTGYSWTGISGGVDAEIFNNEIHGFGYAGVSVRPDITNVWVHHNTIHHCRGAGHGYGVEVAAVTGVLSHDDDFHIASALVEGNTFDYHRHVIANQSGRGSYTFRFNYLGANAAYESQCDVHGQQDSPPILDKVGGEYVYCAGENTEIYNNTSVCDIANGVDEFVWIRGAPYSTGHIYVFNNWLKLAGTSGDDISQHMEDIPEYGYYTYEGNVAPGEVFIRMESYDNWYGVSEGGSVDTAAATLVGNDNATLNGMGTNMVGDFTSWGFVWDNVTHADNVSINMYADNWTAAGPADNITIAHLAGGLDAGTTYYFRFIAVWTGDNATDWLVGDELSFKTLDIVPPTISTTTMANGDVALAYDEAVSAVGGTAPFTWTVSAGALPTSLSINAGTGHIAGTPTVAGTYTFTVRCVDAIANEDSQELAILIHERAEVVTTTLPWGTVSTAYSETLTAQYGEGPYVWSIVGGSLGNGLSLNTATGEISGTPLTQAEQNFDVQVTDNIGGTSPSQALTIKFFAASTPGTATTPGAIQVDGFVYVMAQMPIVAIGVLAVTMVIRTDGIGGVEKLGLAVTTVTLMMLANYLMFSMFST